jgi:hypothetical protein
MQKSPLDAGFFYGRGKLGTKKPAIRQAFF